MGRGYTLTQTGAEVQEILDEVEDKTVYGLATQSEDGLMSHQDKAKLDGLDIPSPGTNTPLMDGTGSSGSSTNYARADHRHPSDTKKQDLIDSNHKLDYSLLANTPTIPPAQIQSDWNQTDTSAKDYIKNKPSVAGQVQADWNQTTSTEPDYIKNKPTIPAAQVNSDWDAVSGVAQILNKPTIPTALSQLTDDSTHRVVTDTEKSTWNGKQAALVSGTNIKTINNTSLLGSGDISISGGDVNVIEGIKMNNTSLTPDANKVVDLGTVITAHQDISGKADKNEMSVSTSGDQTTITLKSGTSATVINSHQSLSGKQDTLVSSTNIKTINGNSVLGNGNLSTLTPIVNHGTSDTTYSVTPNTLHIWGEVASLTLTLATPTDATIVNEYMIQFTSGSTATTLSLPSSVEWGNRDPLTGQTEPLVVAADATYQISIVNNIGLWTAIANS